MLDIVTDMSVRTCGIQVRFMYHVFQYWSCNLEHRLRPYCPTIRLKSEISHSSVEICSKRFDRKYMLLYHSIYPDVSFSCASLFFTKAIQTYKYLIYLNMIIVNGMRYRICEQILSVPIWVTLCGHDVCGCISAPINMFIFIRNCSTNWKPYTSVWRVCLIFQPHWLYWESMACYVITIFTSCFSLQLSPLSILASLSLWKYSDIRYFLCVPFTVCFTTKL